MLLFDFLNFNLNLLSSLGVFDLLRDKVFSEAKESVTLGSLSRGGMIESSLDFR